jgi:hypothetical protein
MKLFFLATEKYLLPVCVNDLMWYLSEKTLMRNSVLLLFLVGVSLFQSCSHKDSRKSFSDVVAYNDFIIDRINEVDQCYANALDKSENEKQGLIACDSLFELSNRTINVLEGIQPFQEDSSFCESAKKFALYMASISKQELPQFFGMIYNADRTEEQQGEIDRRAAFLDQHYDAEMAHLNLVQKALSTKYNFQINK